jgi:hypothetical protein
MKDTMKEESMNRVLALLNLGKRRIPERCTLRATRQSIPAAAAALRKFEGPDPLGPDDEDQGRRIERVPGGCIVLNAVKHRAQLAREETPKQDAENNQDWKGLTIG